MSMQNSTPPATPSIVFLDFDDVIATNNFYSAYDLVSPEEKPADLYERLFHPPAVALLLLVITTFAPKIVITTSWLRFFERTGMEVLLARTGMGLVGDALHDAWEAPPERGLTRLGQVDKWLSANHEGESYVILDDTMSGTGLAGSAHDKSGRVVFCDMNVGLHNGHWPCIKAALSSPCASWKSVASGKRRQ